MSRHISRAAAALSYYLLFTFFPVLILANAVLGLMHLDPEAVFIQLEQLLPSSVAELVSDYLIYIGQNNSLAMLLASLVVIFTSASAAFRMIVRSSLDLYQSRSSISQVHYLISISMPLILVIVIYAAVVIMLTGQWFFNIVETYLNLYIKIVYWEWLRFLLLFLIIFLFMAVVYRGTTPKLAPRPPVMVGALGASIALVIVSIIFSHVMGASSRYSVVYGSLASLIVLMLWLYMISTILLLGSALNYVVYRHRLAIENGEAMDNL